MIKNPSKPTNQEPLTPKVKRPSRGERIHRRRMLARQRRTREVPGCDIARLIGQTKAKAGNVARRIRCDRGDLISGRTALLKCRFHLRQLESGFLPRSVDHRRELFQSQVS